MSNQRPRSGSKSKPHDSQGAAAKDSIPRSVGAILGSLDEALREGRESQLVPVPVGFSPLDGVIGGGLRAAELTLIGGSPGVGKTIAALQWARNIAASGRPALYICYEHDERELLLRLLAMEAGHLAEEGDSFAEFETEELRAVLQHAAHERTGIEEVLASNPRLEPAYTRLASYSDHLWLTKASGAHTGLDEIARVLDGWKDDSPILFVDYLQKVSIRPEPAEEAEKVTRIAEGLKELAMSREIAVVSVVAAAMEGLKTKRLRLHHLRGSSALVYEADVALVLNDKYQSLSKVHISFDTVRAETYRQWVVFSIEKNRGGPNSDLEFRKDFSHFRFDPQGGVLTERLVDEKLDFE